MHAYASLTLKKAIWEARWV